ncbi:hypothetical protein [Fortiea contorta]|uniref:hypothetical protein n=1 Tax=Fortiea contorta TaxID=1892405 RepID=UPI0003465C3B|nr:hypothetical protein [Fortiea contorta]
MKIFCLFIPVFFLSFAGEFIPQKIADNQFSNMAAKPIPESANIKVVKVTLLAREEKTPPMGEPLNPHRDIGFASVFIRLTNLQASDAKITIKNIKIVNSFSGKLQEFNFSPQKIILHPLENSEQVFHLKNKTGYSTTAPMQAIVTYQIGNLISESKSAVTEVMRP